MGKPHALVVAFPAAGHVNPMLHLALALARSGITISFVVSEFDAQRQTLPVPPDLPFSLLLLPDGLPPHHVRVTDVVAFVLSVTSTDTMKLPLQAFLRASQAAPSPVTCIIGDTVMLFAQDLATQFSIPYVAFWTQSAASYTLVLQAATGYRPPQGPEGLITAAPGIPPLKQDELNPFLKDPAGLVFPVLAGPFRRIETAAWIMLSTFYELEAETIDALPKEHKVLPVGPLLPLDFFEPSSETSPEMSSRREECLKWLDTQPPASVLYISFGSSAVISPEQFLQFAEGLEASEQPFLWVLRKDLINGHSAVLPDGLLERTKGRASFVSWAPQLKVLRHPSVGGFLTHCGWNSTLESVAAGVPLLCWSYFSDQKMNCKFIVEVWKVGLRLESSEEGFVGKGEIEEKVRELMQAEKGRVLRHRAQGFGEAAMKAAHNQAGSSSRNFQRFVDYMGSLSQPCGLFS